MKAHPEIGQTFSFVDARPSKLGPQKRTMRFTTIVPLPAQYGYAPHGAVVRLQATDGQAPQVIDISWGEFGTRVIRRGRNVT